jgi:RND family efflux transporter MFP subunit
MKYPPPIPVGCTLIFGFCLGLAGCARAPSEAPPTAVSVTVSCPVEQEITDFADFTGRTAAVDSVEVRARVWGYLDKVNFKEGAMVKKGDVLFEVEPRTYQAALDQAMGNVSQLEARLTRLDADLARARQLVSKGSMSREEYDRTVGDRGEAAGSLAAYRAAVDRARLDLEYTKVLAPISGRISRYVVTVGNLVQAGDQSGGTLLTTIVSVDPMYAYFDVDERTVLRVRQLVREGKADSPRDGVVPVWLGLANEGGFPHQGTIDFVDNQVNPKIGTMRLRGVFPNQDQVLAPGLFVRVRAPIGRPHQGLLISERALDTDQGQKIVYVVNDKNEVVSRPVGLGALRDGLREITDGLAPGELVIVNGLQQLRPGVTVDPNVVDMPVSPAAASVPKSEKP